MSDENEVKEGEFNELPQKPEEEPKDKPTAVTLIKPQIVKAAPLIPVFSITEMVAKREFITEFYEKVMVKDVDFGVIPGTKKPTLYKSGAEMLCLMFGLSAKMSILEREFNSDSGFVSYDILCTLYNKDGNIVGTGIGQSNNGEDKHKYRFLTLAGLKEAGLIEADFSRGEAGKEGQSNTYKHPSGFEVKWFGKWPKYRIENKNPINVANTIFKIAGKRAFVDAVLRVTGAGRIFTQDLEDMNGTESSTQKSRSAPAKEQSTSDRKQKSSDEGRTTQKAPETHTAKPQSQPEPSKAPAEKPAASSKPLHQELVKVKLSEVMEKLAENCIEHGDEWSMVYHSKQKRSFVCHTMPNGICYFDKMIKIEADKALEKLGFADIREAAPFFKQKFGMTWSAMRAREKLAVITMVNNGTLVVEKETK